MDSSPSPTAPDPRLRRQLTAEIGCVLGVSLGASAIWSILALIDKATRQVALNRQVTAMNTSRTPDRPWLDLAYQLTGIAVNLVPVALALYLLAYLRRPGTGPILAGLGLDRGQPGRDLIRGAALAAGIGLPGLGLYLLARQLGVNTTVAPANLTAAWWTLPVLVLAAAQAAVLEEVVMVGYLFTRLEQMRIRGWAIVAVSAGIRGAYHLYQGLGGGIGNVAMGVVFGLVYRRTGRVMPLVIAHLLLDVTSFVGYAMLKDSVSWL